MALRNCYLSFKVVAMAHVLGRNVVQHRTIMLAVRSGGPSLKWALMGAGARRAMWAAIVAATAKAGVAVVLTSHSLEEVSPFPLNMPSTLFSPAIVAALFNWALSGSSCTAYILS